MQKVLVSGSTGFVGEKLIKELKVRNYQVVHLVRSRRNITDPQIFWDPRQQKLNASDLDGISAVIHLAGESIMGRWTDEKKAEIQESRILGTRLLAETISKMDKPPKTFITASATGYYGDRGNQLLTETSASGKGFLAETCRKWEGAADSARGKGIRIAHARFGIVLDPRGGALKLMKLPFMMAASTLGSGKQYMSWITREDAVRALIYILEHDSLRGPINIVSPEPVTNEAFTAALRNHVTLPFLPTKFFSFPTPALAVKAATGEMGEALLLSSQRVKPVRLQEAGFEFRHPTLDQALGSFF